MTTPHDEDAAAGDEPPAEHGPATDPNAPVAAAGRWAPLPMWAQLSLLAAAVAVVLMFVLLPRFTAPDPWESLGENGSPARQVAAALETQMSCTAGEISVVRSVLACSHQDADRVAIVFVQSDENGQVAGYTAETLPIGTTPDTGQAVSIANQIASIVTPGNDFAGCTHDRSLPFFCFGSLATWRSPTLEPAQTTGEKERLPSVADLDEAFAGAGWDCSFGICSKETGFLTVEEPLTGLGLTYGAPAPIDEVRPTVQALLALVEDADDLREWAETIEGTVSIVVADRFVAGYVPQAGGGGLFVIDEVAGVLPDVA